MTLVILALDAVDLDQVNYLDMDSYKLENFGSMDTYAHTKDLPQTIEVWPTVATGQPPEKHGIQREGMSEWDNKIVQKASDTFGGLLSMDNRSRIGDIIESLTDNSWRIPETDMPSIFDGDGRYCHNWPGVINNYELEKVWNYVDFKNNEVLINEEELDKRVLSTAASKFAWISEMLNHNSILVGTHVHAIDIGGHIYGKNKNHYNMYYNRIGKFIKNIRENMEKDDELLLLSDHGINCSWLPENDGEIRNHSFRAFSASTTGDRPQDVYDVKQWVESNIQKHENKYYESQENNDIDIPEETLRDLGYIE